jgi:hypothetical protein
MTYKKLQNIILGFTLIIVGFACGDSSTSTDGEQATVNGRVENNESAGKVSGSDQISSVEGAVVTAARVTSSGSLEMIGNAETETDANGQFTLNIDADAVANAAGHVVIMAEKESQQWKAFVHSELRGGSSIELKPLTAESSGEASVYQQVVANGEANLVSKADIEAYIDSEAGSECKDNSEAAAEFASSLAAEAQARAAFFTNQSIQITQEQKNEIRDAKAEAVAELHSRLYASTSQSAKAEAYDAYFDAVANAYVTAGVSANAYARAKESASHMVINGTTELSSNAKSEVRANSAILVAIAIDNATQARMEASGAVESSIQAAAEAGAQLRADLKAQATATKSEVESLFETYNAAIVDVLEQEVSANAQTIVTINSQINNENGVKANLESSLEASLSTDLLVDAYTTFYTGVKTVVDETFTDSTEAEAQLVTDVMILINLAN